MSWRCVGRPTSLRLSSRSSAKISLRNSSIERSSLSAATVAGARSGEDRLDDRLIAGAAANIAADRLDDLFASRRWLAIEQRLGGHQHARRAIAALRGEMFDEGGLQRVKVGSAPQPGDGLDRAAGASLCERDAGEARRAVDQHRAGPAGSLPAAALDGEVADRLAQSIEKIGAAFDEGGDLLAVEGKLNRSPHRRLSLSARAEQEPAQMDGKDFAPPPGAGDGV